MLACCVGIVFFYGGCKLSKTSLMFYFSSRPRVRFRIVLFSRFMITNIYTRMVFPSENVVLPWHMTNNCLKLRSSKFFLRNTFTLLRTEFLKIVQTIAKKVINWRVLISLLISQVCQIRSFLGWDKILPELGHRKCSELCWLAG